MFALEDYRVVDVLMLVGNLAPVALYFLALGLVNSHARPYLITSRSDFILLTSVLIPVLIWPVPAFAVAGTWWPLVLGGGAAVGVFLWMLPSAEAGFVVYNVSEARCRRLVLESLRSVGWEGSWDGNTWRARSGEFCLHLSEFGLLRNVALHFDPAGPRTEAFGLELDRRLKTVSQLPSNMGVCLVVIGVGLLIAPIWMVGRHIHDLVDAMSHVFG